MYAASAYFFDFLTERTFSMAVGMMMGFIEDKA